MSATPNHCQVAVKSHGSATHTTQVTRNLQVNGIIARTLHATSGRAVKTRHDVTGVSKGCGASGGTRSITRWTGSAFRYFSFSYLCTNTPLWPFGCRVAFSGIGVSIASIWFTRQPHREDARSSSRTRGEGFSCRIASRITSSWVSEWISPCRFAVLTSWAEGSTSRLFGIAATHSKARLPG